MSLSNVICAFLDKLFDRVEVLRSVVVVVAIRNKLGAFVRISVKDS